MTAEYWKEYYQRNKEKIRARAKAWWYEKGRSRQGLWASRISAPVRQCAVCGQDYMSRRKTQTTCGNKCKYSVIADRQRGHCHVPEESLERGAEKRLEHPHTGPYVTNFAAKDGWSLMSPDGSVFKFRNMSNFIREHQELFDPADIVGCEKASCLAAHQLRRLSPYRKHPIKSWKGWSWHH